MEGPFWDRFKVAMMGEGLEQGTLGGSTEWFVQDIGPAVVLNGKIFQVFEGCLKM